MKTLFVVCLFVLLISACRTPESSLLSEHFNTGKLPAQSFIINPDVDTTIVTNGGVRINITKGSFSSDKPVTMEWKEALQFNDMLRAGLLTQSGKDILSSGDMFYLNTKEKVSIKKPIKIEVPTNTIVQGMQLYKGDLAEGKINWQEPKPIENIKAFGDNVLGKALFNGNCRQCHVINGRDPSDLSGITERKSKQWLYAITRNFATMMAIDPYLQCLKCKYGVMMQSFPGLTEADMDSIYNYIENATERLGLTGVVRNNSCDTCAIYDNKYDSLLKIYNDLYTKNFLTSDSLLLDKFKKEEKSSKDYKLKQVIFDLAYRDSTLKVKLDKQNKGSSKEFIQGKNYYQVTIQAKGWYNIDVLLEKKSGSSTTKLIVKPQGERNKEMEYYLAIPALKIFTSGFSYGNGDEIVFYNQDDSIKLPQQRQAFIIAVGGTEGKYFFSKTTFIISEEQTINLRIQKMSEQQFKAQLTELSYYGLASSVTSEKAYQENAESTNEPASPLTTPNSRYENPLTSIEKQLQKLASKKSKNCGCDTYPLASVSKDSTSAPLDEQGTAPAKAP